MTAEQQIYALQRRIREMRIERSHRLIGVDLVRALRPAVRVELLPFPLIGSAS